MKKYLYVVISILGLSLTLALSLIKLAKAESMSLAPEAGLYTTPRSQPTPEASPQAATPPAEPGTLGKIWDGTKGAAGTAWDYTGGAAINGAKGAYNWTADKLNFDEDGNTDYKTVFNQPTQNPEVKKNIDQVLCTDPNRDTGPNFPTCKRDAVIYEPAKHKDNTMAEMAPALGMLTQNLQGMDVKTQQYTMGGVSALTGLLATSDAAKFDGLQNKDLQFAKENQIMSHQNADIAAIKGTEVIEADKHAPLFAAKAKEAQLAADEFGSAQAKSAWGGLAMLGLGAWQIINAKKFEDPQQLINDKNINPPPFPGLEPLASNDASLLRGGPEFMGKGDSEEKDKANNYENTGSQFGSGSIGSKAPGDIASGFTNDPSQRGEENQATPNYNTGLNMLPSGANGGEGENMAFSDLVKQMLGSPKKGEERGLAETQASLKTEDDKAKMKALGKNVNLFEIISQAHKKHMES